MTGQLLASTVLLYDIQLQVATENETVWAPEPVLSLGRRDAEPAVASGHGNQSNGMSEA